MIIRKVLPNPIPWQYGYENRPTGALWYSPTPKISDEGDPQFNTRGEGGYYYDTQLGGLGRPGFFERLRARRALRGLRNAEPLVTDGPATTEDVVAIMNAHNDRVFALTVVSTAAVAVSALVTIFRTLKLIRDDSKD